MIQFLLTFSLFLHGITFVIVIYLYRQIKEQNNTEEMKKSIREVEDLFESYLLELKDENEKLVHILNENGKNVKVQSKNTTNENNTLTESLHIEEVSRQKEIDPQVDTNKTNTQQSLFENDDEQNNKTLLHGPKKVYDVPFEPLPIDLEDKMEEPSLESRVLLFYNQGSSIEEIARKLNKGKTEIELILKFHLKD